MIVKEDFVNRIKEQVQNALLRIGAGVFTTEAFPELIVETPPSLELGDIAFPMFRFSRVLKMAPAQVAQRVKDELHQSDLICEIQVKGAYLNLFFDRSLLSRAILMEILQKKEEVGTQPAKNQKILVEFSCPNTNKPLHLGHCRNNILGDSISRIFKKAGFDVKKINLINDRGVHICKSMLAYQLFGNGITPESAGKKSDHLVGDFYVKFAAEQAAHPELEKQAQELLVKWEDGDPATLELWKQMNQWAVDGIRETYRRMGISFDHYQFESETYQLGKDIVETGVGRGVFYRESDGSVWIDNEDVGLDKKIVLRSDGTSIYITQDLGTAVKRQELFQFDRMIYVVGSEQVYHFQTLFAIMKKLGYEWAKDCYHLSYGMVNLPEGKMKSREGKVVDADNLMELLYQMSFQVVAEKHPEWQEEEKSCAAEKISLGALKYYLLNFNTAKDILFLPEKSISFDGNTGPYLQYSTARIHSLLTKAGNVQGDPNLLQDYPFEKEEWEVISQLMNFDYAVLQAAAEYSPLEICSYLYELARSYNKMYHELPILGADNEISKSVRLMITQAVQYVLKAGLSLLGIDSLERM